MRLGSSDLADHTGYNYIDPSKCPACNKNIIETNEHYMEECGKYKVERKELYNKIKGILRENNLPFNTKTLLGFNLNYKKVKERNNNVLEKIFYLVNQFNSGTKRFANTEDLQNKKK